MFEKRPGKSVKLGFKVVRQKDQPDHPAFGWKLSEKAKRDIVIIERHLIRG